MIPDEAFYGVAIQCLRKEPFLHAIYDVIIQLRCDVSALTRRKLQKVWILIDVVVLGVKMHL